MNLIDCHTHTQFSFDSDADIRAMISRAAELNLAAYAITDHCECNWWYPKEHYDTPLSEDFNFGADYEASVSTITALKEEYAGLVNLICGTEMGQAVQAPEIAAKINADPRVDYIIGSVHQIRNEWDFYYLDYHNMTESAIYSLLDRYFDEILELCRMNCFDILGHLTYGLRYLGKKNDFTPDMSRYRDVIAESLRTVAQNGKGIEINVSGLRNMEKKTSPTLEYVKLFRDLGGEVISVGSDAHTVEDLGANIAEGAEMAKAAGFRYLCYFKDRKPHFVAID